MDGGSPAADGVVAASRRVGVARRVHADLVRDALAGTAGIRWSGCCG